ncbi:DUF4232 domain-containing protein [Streptomyces glaucus]|uniref:DUF4232 domain-containing protein n=1 Tax=Streptomyces glaucus TaxID=284029 RepID=A0ABP5WB00_9ACTN
MRTHRTALPRTRLLAAAGVTLAALALTACNDGTGTRDEGAQRPTAAATTAAPTADGTGAPAASSSSSSSATATATASSDKGPAASRGSAAGRNTPSAASADTDPHAPENRVSCNGSNTAVTAQPVPRPLNHLLITVKNTGSKTCDLTYYPVLRFDGMQWAPQAIESSKPQAVTTLAPGQSGYAGVLLSAADGSGDGGATGHRLTVGFQGRTPGSSGGPAATPALPAEGVHYDSSLKVTYWQTSMADALAY